MTDFFDDLELELRRAHRRDTARHARSRGFVRRRLPVLAAPDRATLVALAAVAAVAWLVAGVLTVARYLDVERRTTVPGTGVVVTDVEAGIRFSLDGRVLTAQVLPSAPEATRRRVSGARISATCGANVAAPPGDPRRETTLTRLWLPRETSLSYRFPRDVSRWCKLDSNRGNFHVFVWFPGASAGPREAITETANTWARLFSFGPQIPYEPPDHYMSQPAVERMTCQRVGAPKPIPNCTRPSRAYRRSFHAATVQEIAINGDRAAARFSNGETIELRGTDRSWLVAKWGENAGRGFFK
jgi:hypothetical protein